ncbi:class I SAM-dependent methyltransferase [Ktedonospora formicarum]|uniref:Methyltransferase domain-containing protein n=1 Tax=Ktedonospora formicarum TaxID=2778364 RepID=A0A8J3HWH6_9CHLR|nr:class I SAM-dependent methyltransferase [Ktedonospora formicarum]GHO41898.1 hypothetical protein KSX_00610 [Ktedonospora formicarum]
MPWFWRAPKNTTHKNSRVVHAAKRANDPVDLDMLPKDLREVNRLDFQHYFMRQALNSNYLAPIQRPTGILDIGCGTGRWMAEMAQKFPQASVTSTDVTPISLTNSSIPFSSNCHFQQNNVLDGLPFLPNTFDFSHLRFLSFALPLQTWPSVVQELIRVTRPGGWVELVEPDLTLRNPGPETVRLLQLVGHSCETRGLDVTIGKKLSSFLQNAGLTNVIERKISIPMGSWGGRIGSMLAINYDEAAVVLKPLVTAITKVPPEEYDFIVEAWQRENNMYHTTCDFYVAYGQRP